MAHAHDLPDSGRRDFLLYATAALGAAGAAVSLWPFVHSMNPAADILALSTTEVDLAPIAVGQAVTAMWQGKPVFIRHRTAGEIDAARAVPPESLPDPAADGDRVTRPEWLVVIGICTHLGCVPLGQKASDPRGQFAGYFCPCHGSHYDTAGRIRKGPAPRNLDIPPHRFLDGGRLLIG